ncbi:coproporphyrinogen III oxidase, partial [Vibrio xuii]
MNVTLLAIAGGVIILGLASYAGYLLLQLKKQKELQEQHKQLAIEKRNANIFESVSVLCLAGIQGQCDLSEISIRVYNIMDYVQGEERVDFDKEYPATSELFHIVKDMPRGDERQ